MKKFLIIFVILIFGFSFFGCSDSNDDLVLQKEKLISEIAELEIEKEAAKSEIANIKEENGMAKYVITFEISQTHVTLKIGEHIKDSLNRLTVEIPVDKEYYESLSVGDIINNDFRMGSLVMRGSFGNWKITVTDKTII